MLKEIKRKYYNLITNRIESLKKQSNNMKMYTLSSLINNHKLFLKFVYDAYCVTEDLQKDYPNYFEWFWSKEFPRIFNGTGEIVICKINNNVAGVTFLKKDSTERKICTFFVLEKYRRKHVGTRLLEYSFKFLGTTKPLFTIADYKFPMFKNIIRKYDWKLTQIKNKGYYNMASRELVFNGELS